MFESRERASATTPTAWELVETYSKILPARRSDEIHAGSSTAGAGAATAYARACGWELATSCSSTASRTVRARSPRRAVCARAGRVRAADDVREWLDAADGLIHATPTGINGHPGLPVPEALLRADLWVAEVVCSIETELLRAAKRQGCRAGVDGAEWRYRRPRRSDSTRDSRCQRVGVVAWVLRGLRIACASIVSVGAAVDRRGRAPWRRPRARSAAVADHDYLDFAVLGIAAPAIRPGHAISPALMGIVFIGVLLDVLSSDRCLQGHIFSMGLGDPGRVPPCRLSWSVVTLLHSLATGFASLLGLQLAAASPKVPCFPPTATWSRIVTASPAGPRNRDLHGGRVRGPQLPEPAAVLDSERVRLAGAVRGRGGGRHCCGLRVQRPLPRSEQSRGRQRRGTHLDQSRGAKGPTKAPPTRFEFVHIRALFRHRQMWGLCIGQYAVSSTFVFFLTWFPTYLAAERHMDWIRVGVFTALPYIAGFLGVIFTRVVVGLHARARRDAERRAETAGDCRSGRGVHRRRRELRAERPHRNSHSVARLLRTAMSSSGLSVVSEVAPRAQLGLVSGLFNASANLSGILTPLVDRHRAPDDRFLSRRSGVRGRRGAGRRPHGLPSSATSVPSRFDEDPGLSSGNARNHPLQRR